MIFHELYSAYYRAIAEILRAVQNGITDEKALRAIAEKYAFSESAPAILSALKSEKWQVLNRRMQTPIRHAPTIPVTDLEKRWLKAISLDARVRLFDLSFEGLEDVKPLFTPDDFCVYDRYADGDPYFDEAYVRVFRTLLQAVRKQQRVTVEAVNRRGIVNRVNLLPKRLEYSEKDDKFRVISAGGTLNLARILSCAVCDGKRAAAPVKEPDVMRTVVLRIVNERNALERCMLHFAHFEKQAERIDEKRYLLRIRYDLRDETEMVIRILSFGPRVEVTEPASFRELIAQRLRKQRQYIK